jgi:hypothetical protein
VKAIEDGLKKLVFEEWDWQVEWLSKTDFSVVFPNTVSLQLCKNAADLTLPASKIRIIVLDSICNPPGAPPLLSEIWTRVHGLPPCLLEAERLKAALEMVGKPILVDADSLIQDLKAVMVQFLVHVPSFPKLAVNLFINGKGSKVLVVPKALQSGTDEGSPPPPPQQDKDKDKDKEEEEDNDNSDHNDSDSHWKRRKTKAIDTSPAQGSKDNPPAKQASAVTITKKFSRQKKPGLNLRGKRVQAVCRSPRLALSQWCLHRLLRHRGSPSMAPTSQLENPLPRSWRKPCPLLQTLFLISPLTMALICRLTKLTSSLMLFGRKLVGRALMNGTSRMKP